MHTTIISHRYWIIYDFMVLKICLSLNGTSSSLMFWVYIMCISIFSHEAVGLSHTLHVCKQLQLLKHCLCSIRTERQHFLVASFQICCVTVQTLVDLTVSHTWRRTTGAKLSALKQQLHTRQNLNRTLWSCISQTSPYLVAFSPVDDVFHRAVHFLPLCFQGLHFLFKAWNLESNQTKPSIPLRQAGALMRTFISILYFSFMRACFSMAREADGLFSCFLLIDAWLSDTLPLFYWCPAPSLPW